MLSTTTRRIGVSHLAIICALLVASLLFAYQSAEAQSSQTLTFVCSDRTGQLYIVGGTTTCPSGLTRVDLSGSSPAVTVCVTPVTNTVRIAGMPVPCMFFETTVILHGPTETFACSSMPLNRSFRVRMLLADANGQCRPGSYRLVIPPGNPVATDDSYVTGFQTPLVVPPPGVLANDSTNSGTVVGFDAVSSQGGTVSVAPDGGFTYTPPAGFVGTDTFGYTISNGTVTSSATVTIEVMHFTVANDDEYVIDDTFTGSIPAPGVLGNDEVNGATITAYDATTTAGGTVVLNGDGSFSYSPPAIEPASDSFTYTLTNPVGSDTATVTLTFNQPPDAVDDTATTDEDTSLTVVAPGVLTNDTDPDLDPLTVVAVNGVDTNVGTQVTLPSGAMLTLESDGAYLWAPNNAFNNLAVGEQATDSFTYTVSDGNGGTDTATVTITVTGLNDPPTAVDDGYTTGADSVLSVPVATGVLANDTDPDTNDTLTVSELNGQAGDVGTQVTLASGALLTLNADGSFDWDPNGVFDDLAAGESATETFDYTLSDGNGGSDTATVTITITGVNDAPTADDQSVTTLEDVPLAITLTGSDPDTSDILSFSVATGPSNGDLTGSAPNLTYTPDADFNGSDSFTFTVDDGNGGTDTGTISITVAAVNDAPEFTLGDDVTVDEDAGPQSLTGWATGIRAGPVTATDESGQVLTFNISTAIDSGDLTFTSGPAIDPATGNLTFEAAANTSGVATITVSLSDDGGTADGGDDTSDTQTFTITVTSVNDPPSFTGGGDVTVNEDSGAYSATWATGISAGPNETGQTLTFTVTPDDTTLFSVQPAIDASGTLTFTPAADASGSTTVTVTLSDDGGGDDTSAPQTFTLTITAINDAPSFTASDPPAINEDAGPQSITNWVTSVSTGPADESGQSIQGYIVTNIVPESTLSFTSEPAVAADGTLTYTAAPNTFGTATFDVAVQDNGGTANGGVDTSPTQTFTITVNAVNDAPSFTSGGDVTVNEDSGAYNAGWATGISAGPNETGQTLTFNVSNNNNSLFSSQPSIASDGTLTFTPEANAFGSATVTVTLSDDGGTGNGGDDTSDAQTFTITVNPINDPPVVDTDNIRAYTARASLQSTFDAASGLLSNVVDQPNETGTPFTMRFSGTTVTAPTLVSVTNGSIFVQTDGSFTFDAAAGFSGATSFTYEVCDSGTGTPASACTSVTVNVTVEGPIVFFVDDSAAAGGTGTLNDPFQSLTELDGRPTPTPSNATVIIFVFEGTTYTGTITLKDNETLLSQGSFTNGTTFVAGYNTFTIPDITNPPATSQAYPTFSGTRASIGTASIVLANSNIVDGFILSTGSTTAISASGKSGTTLVQDIDITLSSTGTGIGLTNQGGTLNVTNVTVGGGTSGTSLSLSGGNGTVTFTNADFTQPGSGRVVAISGRTSGPAHTVTFDSNSLVNATSGTGVLLDDNDQATIAFQGGVTLSTGVNAAFTATNGGTVTVTGSANTLVTTTGTALNISNTTIGATGVTFRSISANGAPNGIVLNSTGTSAGLTVAGNGGTCSSAGTCTGGAIQNTTGDGLSLSNTRNVSLTRLFVGSTGGHGINTSAVNGLTLTAMLVQNAGNADNEYGLHLLNVQGTVTIDGTSFNNAADNLVYLANNNVNATVNVTNSSRFEYPSGVGPAANSAMLFEPGGTAALTVSIQGATFTNIVSAAAQIGANLAASSGTQSFTFSNNTINVTLAGRASGVVISPQENTTTNLTITNNTFNGAGGNGVISIDTNDAATVLGTVSSNAINNPPGIGIFNAVDEGGTSRITFNNNSVTNAGSDGIQVVNFGGVGVSTLCAAITNNTVSGHSLSSTPGIAFVGGISVISFEDSTCIALTGNTVTGASSNPTQCGGVACVDYYIEEVGGVMQWQEIPNTAATTLSAAYVQSTNSPGTASVTLFGTIDLTNGVACPLN